MITEFTDLDGPQTPAELGTYQTQQRFLAQFSGHGTILKAAEAAGITRQTVYNWFDNDTYGFHQRLEHARADFAESEEDILFKWNQSKKPNPLLLMFSIKAHNRGKYGDQVVVVNDKASELLAAVRGLPSGPVVEGEVVSVSGEEEVLRAVGRGDED